MDARSNPLEALSPDQLRRRTSLEWRTHTQDVLPLWVAVMDVPLVPPVVRAVHEAIGRGDTGYPAGTDHAPFYAFVTHDARRAMESPLGEDLRIDPDALESAFAGAREQHRLPAEQPPTTPPAPPTPLPSPRARGGWTPSSKACTPTGHPHRGGNGMGQAVRDLL